MFPIQKLNRTWPLRPFTPQLPIHLQKKPQSSFKMPDFGDHVNMGLFDKILELDDNSDDREFSQAIVTDFFVQFETTIQEIDAAM